MLRYCENLKAIRYESTTLNRIVADKSHRVIVASGPVYTTTNTQHIAIYPGKFKFILVKISPDSGRLHGRNAKENQTLVTFFTAGNLSGLPCLFTRVCKYREH